MTDAGHVVYRYAEEIFLLGRQIIDSLRERFYAISAEKKLKHPAVVAIAEAAKNKSAAQARRSSCCPAAEEAAANGPQRIFPMISPSRSISSP